MGRAAAWDLARHQEVASLLLVDSDTGALAAARAFLEERGVAPDRYRPQRADLSRPAEASAVMEGLDAVLSAVPYRFNAALARTAVDAGVSFCDLGGNPSVVDEELALHDDAIAAGVTVVPDCGLAPGTTNVLTAALLEGLPEATVVRIRVGGLPAHPRPPLNYKLVFSPTGLINEYVEPCRVLRDGALTEVLPLSEPEELHFPEPFGRLEARQTAGGTSTLPTTYADRLTDLDYKTIRYPGHYEIMEGMAALGLFGSDPVDIDGAEVSPRGVVEHLLAIALDDDDTDVVLLQVTATDEQGRGEGFRLIDRYDAETGLSAMQRTTSLPAAVTTLMLADGTVTQKGALPPERAVPAGPFLEALADRGLRFERFEVGPDSR
jgi:lysine 6-dehydrogenase